MYKVSKFLATLIVCLGMLLSQIGVQPAQADPTIYRVALTGANTSTCGTETEPCLGIQKAINRASSGDIILVAGGVYSNPPDTPPSECYSFTSTKSIFCLIDKQLTIRGGYSTSNWEVSDPLANPTILDGLNLYRGATVLENGSTPAKTSLTLENFIIQNGLAQGNLTATGGGLFIDKANFALRNIIFQNNKSIGGNTTTQAAGGTSSGGGLSITDMPVGTTGVLENLTFSGNEARGGVGKDRGGLALGGGFYIWRGSVTASHLTVIDNISQGGHTSGSGKDGSGMPAEAVGGGFSIHEGSAEMSYLLVSDNYAIGGDGTTYAGGGYGGGIELEYDSYLRIADSTVQNNHAIGGNAQRGAMAGGGGFLWDRTTVIIDRVRIIANTVKGGTGTTERGSAVGGGVHAMRSSGSATVTVLNSVIANNTLEFGDGSGSAIFGAGGGMLLEGYQAEIVHSTFSGNQLSPEMLYGAALTIKNSGSTPSSVSLAYSLITNHVNTHTTQTQSTLHAWSGNTFNLNRGLFAGNSLDTNLDGEPPTTGGPGIFNGIASMLYASSAGYIAPAAPYYNYHLRSTSPAKDQASSSTLAIDFETDNRPFAATADIGADEYVPFALTNAQAGAATLLLDWAADALGESAILSGVDHYDILVTCPNGANPPAQGSCGVPFTIGQATTFTLTGLSPFAAYTIVIQAKDSAGNILAVSVETTATLVEFREVYIPLTLR